MIPTWVHIIYYLYGVPLILLYTLIIIVLLKKRTTISSVFYNFVAIFGIQDVLYYVFLQYEVRGPMSEFVLTNFFTGLQIHSPKWHMVIIFVRVSLEFNGVVSTVVLSLIRISSMLFPLNHERMWKKALPVVICLNIVLPFGLYGYLLLNKAILLCAGSHGNVIGCFMSYDHSFTNHGMFSMSTTNKYMYTILPTISASLNIIALILLYSRKKALKSHRHWRQEINLSISSFLMFAAHVSYGILNMFVINYMFIGDLIVPTVVAGIVVPIIFDVALFTTVLSLLISSKQLRTEISRIVFGSRRKVMGVGENKSWLGKTSTRDTPVTVLAREQGGA
ncbi:unnamed protein product [Bursaphelenchus xylophilus]|uniref:Serpentine receptor class gamma n=1 Tax=Bursaphelenchus xylophilus TaxID=6326 RepID=A0A1I7RYR5_BURXY|nr:unnamed protein product [Bursaphelenchus xylophilus]CAG9092345.1 unnamed protein product [Bursaphelenchus xylophilus]